MRERQRRPDSAERAERLQRLRGPVVDATSTSDRSGWASIARARPSLRPRAVARDTTSWLSPPRTAPLSVIPLRRGRIRPDEHDPFFAAIIEGLSSRPRSIPSEWLWDARGARLHAELAERPEHYAIRAQRQLVAQHGEAMISGLGGRATLVEVGPGDAQVTREMVERLRPMGRTSMSIERPDATRALDVAGARTRGARAVVLLAGPSIGSLAPHAAASLLSRAALVARRGGAVLVAVEHHADRRTMEAAYADRLGLGAAFHRNVLVRINREIGATFDVTRFTHRVTADRVRGRVEASLVSEVAQRVRIGGRQFAIERGDEIIVEHRHTYEIIAMQQLARRAGLAAAGVWTDATKRVSVHRLAVA